METAALLMKLADMNIISGTENESDLKKVILEYLDISASDLYYDRLGNLTVSLTKSGDKHFMIEAHADETGFIVTDITENGFIRFAPVGGT